MLMAMGWVALISPDPSPIWDHLVELACLVETDCRIDAA